jgi:hypothetical protein
MEIELPLGSGHIPWPPCSPYLATEDFFLLRFLKSVVYKTCSQKSNITITISAIDQDTMPAVIKDVMICCHEYIASGAAHLKNVLF